jgi:hypothetical protein
MELHTYPAHETRVDNPFIAEIEKEGIELLVPENTQTQTLKESTASSE